MKTWTTMAPTSTAREPATARLRSWALAFPLAAMAAGPSCAPRLEAAQAQRGAEVSSTSAQASARARAPSPPRMPGPERRGGAAALRENDACEGCHSDVAAEWRASMHRRSHEDPAYQRAFAIEPAAFCTRCHAPEAEDPAAEVTSEISQLGVGCVTCHGAGDEVLAAPRGPGSRATSAPHGVRRDARFASADACASCHEFAFPDRGAREAPELMQSTVREHAASPFAEASCASCHMPPPPGAPLRKSHAFSASRDPEALRRAVRVEAARVGPTTVRITLRPVGLGHAFPTGDLFRRVELLAQAVGPETQLVSEAARYAARHFENRRRRFTSARVLALDDRVGSKSDRNFDLTLGPEAAAFPVLYRVTYQRVENSRSVDDRDARVDGETVLAEGVLSP